MVDFGGQKATLCQEPPSFSEMLSTSINGSDDLEAECHGDNIQMWGRTPYKREWIKWPPKGRMPLRQHGQMGGRSASKR